MSAFDILKILFVINPRSGSRSKINWKQAITDYFIHHNHIVEYFIIDEKTDINALKKVIDELKPHRVVAVGGDGTVTTVARQLIGTNIAMGILPAGSANGMAKELNISPAPAEALDIVVTGKVKDCDLIQINNTELCLHLSDIGLNAQLIKYFEEGKLRGKLGYARSLFKTLWLKERMRVTVQTGKEEIRREAFMIVLANASKYGTGAVINPDGVIDDGYFEVVIVKKLAFSEFFKMLFRPQRFDPQKIQVFQARSVTIDTRRKMHFQIDGEYKGRVSHVEAAILHRQIKLLLPVVPLL